MSADLNRWYYGYEPYDEEPGDTAPIDERLEWQLRQMARLDERIARHQDTYDRERAKLDTWRDRVTGPLHDRYATAELVVSNLMLARLAEEPKVKSVDLPSGIVRTRAGASSVIVDDETAFREWAEHHKPSLLHEPAPIPPRRPDKKAIRDYLKEGPEAVGSSEDGGLTLGGCHLVSPDGEIVPGVRLFTAATTVTVDLNTEEGNE